MAAEPFRRVFYLGQDHRRRERLEQIRLEQGISRAWTDQKGIYRNRAGLLFRDDLAHQIGSGSLYKLAVDFEALFQHGLHFVPEIAARRRADDDLTFLFRCGNHALPFWIRLSAERMTVQA